MSDSLPASFGNEYGNSEPLKMSLQNFISDVQTAVFFDNDKNKIDEVVQACGNIIKGIQIPETSAAGASEKFGSLQMNLLRTKLKNKAYFDYTTKTYPSDVYDIKSGIQDSHLAECDMWLDETKGVRRAAIFDWDRTLTMFEGFGFDTYGGFTFEDLLRYLFGGDERYEKLQAYLQKLHSQNVELIILTNNGACGNPNPAAANFYKQMVDTFMNGLPYTLICSKVTANRHKGEAIKKDSRFSKCAASGGKRKTRGKKKRSTTRKRNGRLRSH
jgi:hypothetical protein